MIKKFIEHTLKLDMLNWSFTKIQSSIFLDNKIEGFEILNQDENLVEVKFIMDSYFANREQVRKVKFFTVDFSDKFLGMNIEQIREDLLNNVTGYVFTNSTNENQIRYFELVNINENIFEKYGLESHLYEKTLNIPNAITLGDDEDKDAWTFYALGTMLTNSLNLDCESRENYYNNRSEFIGQVCKLYKIENNQDVFAFEYYTPAPVSHMANVLAPEESSGFDFEIFKVNKNQDFISQFGRGISGMTFLRLVTNHRSLFEPNFMMKEQLSFIPTNENFGKEKFELKRVNLDIAKIEETFISTRNEFAQFDESTIQLYKDFGSLMYSFDSFISKAVGSKLSIKRAKKQLTVFEEEDFIYDYLELFENWFKILGSLLELNKNANLVEWSLDELEDLLSEENGYFVINMSKTVEAIKEDFENIDLTTHDVNKILEVVEKNNGELSEESKSVILTYAKNAWGLHDIVNNSFKYVKLIKN